jgi:signal transduction histidine kinase/ActR/RegA family two-component response regulator
VSHELLRTVHPVPLPQLLDILRTQREWAGELRQRARDGREIIVQSRLQLFEMDGQPIVLKSDHDITAQQRATVRAIFMNQVGNVLAGSLDYQTTLTAVANLAVPTVADCCAVDILEDGKLERVAVAHVDPTKVDQASSLERYDDPTASYSPITVTRTGVPCLLPTITPDTISGSADESERTGPIESLRLLSYMCVPLVAHGRTLGALTLATAESGRQYGDDEFRFAQDLAHRAALAVDNARAYQAMQTADRLKDEFLATLSHELRTPLNAILGYAKLLRGGSLSADKTDHAIEIVERNADALRQLVEDVLDVSRIISGKVRLNIQAVDLPQVVADAIESLMPAAELKNIRIQTTADPNASPISGDPDRLQQIVWNLVSNSVKFTPKGGRVQVRLERINSHIDITVSDTGIGIKPDVLPYVFERFRQADSATTRQFGGLGLGLAIVRHLVELHGGTVDATSDGENQGATFRVRLPLMIVHSQSAVEERRRRHTAGRVVAPGAGKLAGLHILAVDDDSDALTLVREVLELAGARVTTIDRGLDALDLLRATKPAIVLVDIGLPDIDGYEFVRRLRKLDDPQLRITPAIALTAYARAEDRVKALETGFELHLAKPADPAELVAAVLAAARRER